MQVDHMKLTLQLFDSNGICSILSKNKIKWFVYIYIFYADMKTLGINTYKKVIGRLLILKAWGVCVDQS